MATDSLDLRDIAARYTAAWCSQEPESVAEFYSPEGSLQVNSGPVAIGRQAIAEVARSFMLAFPDLQVVMTDVRTEAWASVYQWTLSGTNTGPGGTGRRVLSSGFERWSFGEDGLIAASQGHFDAAEFSRQLEHGA